MTTLREILELLPLQKAKPSVPPYSDPKIKYSEGRIHINMDYRFIEFERAPREPEFTLAFKFFYDLKTNGKNAVDRTERHDYVTMWIPSDNHKIRIEIDTNKQFIYLGYERDDAESKNIVDEFLALLKVNISSK